MHPIKKPADSFYPQQDVFPPALAYLWTRTGLLKEVRDLVQAVKAWPGVLIEPNDTGIDLTLSGAALGHLSWSGRLDLPFGPEIGDRLVAEEMVNRHPDEDRFTFDVRSEEDVDRALWLLRLAYLSVDSNGPAQERNVGQRRNAPGRRSI